MAYQVTSRAVAANDLVPGRAGMAVPAVIIAATPIEDLDLHVTMRIRVEPGGSWRIVELMFRPLAADGIQHDAVMNPPGAVTARALRAVRLDAIAREAIAQQEVAKADRSDIQPGAFQVPGDPRGLTWLGDPRPRRPQDELVTAAAQIYLSALRSGNRAPTQAVASKLGYSRSQASRLIRQARDQGRIPEAPDRERAAARQEETRA